jgi:uridine kinase
MTVMAIRVLLDHGVPESNIIFLTFLIARRGHISVHRAFPSIRIVTAAIDPGLEEMHFPLNGLLLGEAAGEGDFGAQFIDERPGEIERDDKQEGDAVDEKEAEVRRLKFSRTKRESVSVSEKRAWVVSPGMGHIG